MEDFGGRIVHPQFWPADLDYSGKKVVVIGSGATAVTLVPAMAESAAHVTMLQRSPTYVVSRPAEDATANWLRAKFHDATFGHSMRRQRCTMWQLFPLSIIKTWERLAHTGVVGDGTTWRCFNSIRVLILRSARLIRLGGIGAKVITGTVSRVAQNPMIARCAELKRRPTAQLARTSGSGRRCSIWEVSAVNCSVTSTRN
jgi:hypothetical protein